MSTERGHRRASSQASGQVPRLGLRSRRGSWASISSRGAQLDKEALSQALDEIHTSASQQETLTSFSDYDGGGSLKVAGPKEMVAGGLAGLYSRFRQSVVGGSPETLRPTSSGSHARSESGSTTGATFGSLRPLIDSDVRRSSSGTRAGRGPRDSTASSPSLRPTRNRQSREVDVVRLDAPQDLALMPTTSHTQDSSSTQSQPPSVEVVSNESGLGAQAADRPTPRSPRLQSSYKSPERIGVSTGTRQISNLSTLTSDFDHSQPESDRSGESSESSEAGVSESTEKRGTEKKFEPLLKSPRTHHMVTDLKPRVNDHSASISAASRRSGMSKSVTLAKSTSTASSSTLPNPIARITDKAIPTVNLSRASSAADSADLTIRPSSTRPSAARTPSAEAPPNLNEGFRRAHVRHADSSRHGHGHPHGHRSHTVVPAHLKRRVVSKEFWMKDENARDCFYCGDPFSTFRRKHHCRTCGQIFDAKCMVLISGKPFDLPSTLRICRPCEAVIYGSDDDSTVFSEDDEDKRASVVFDGKLPPLITEHPLQTDKPLDSGEAAITTPSIGIPASRRTRESKRRSAVIEFDANHILARPGSSRSLKSSGGRPRSSSHRRLPSKHQHSRSIRAVIDERAPFHQETNGADSRQALPAFHNDNIIDPDLAPFMSDEDSEDDHASMFTVLNGGSHSSSLVDQDRIGFSSLAHSNSKKGRTRALSDRLKEHDGPRLPARPASKLRKRHPSVASISYARPSPRRSRSQTLLFKDTGDATRLDGSDTTSLHEVLSRGNLEGKIKKSAAMHGIDAPRIELNVASMQHVRNLLVQLLRDNKALKWKAWEKALMPIVLQCTDDVEPDVQHGDDMDIRNYIKLKKIPGGRAGDTAYVSGVVFSKNIAMKGMKRNFIQPRIVIVTFALEYARHNAHFMSLDPILAQEREYLRNLVGRIAALRPHILLVQKNVSGIALQMLFEAGITVIHGVKASVLAAVARVTRTIMIKSVDKLSMDPTHLGQCESFDVKTYMNDGKRRTYIFISGCQPNLGCTIVLRGAPTEALRQVKRITEFMCYVVYNLKLETCLMRDEFVLIPTSTKNVESSASKTMAMADRVLPDMTTSAAANAPITVQDSSLPIRAAQEHREREQSDSPVAVKDEDAAGSADESISSQYRELIDSSQTRLMSSSPFVKFTEPFLLQQVLQQERLVAQHKKLLDRFAEESRDNDKDESVGEFEMVQPDMLDDVDLDSQKLSMTTRHSLRDIFSVRYQKALQDYRMKKKQWDAFFEGSNGKPFDPFMHQNIFVLQSLVSSLTSAPCAGPEVIGLAFYAGYEHVEMNYEEDCTLGQFVEDICVGASTGCKTCGRKMVDHTRQYVHGNGQLSVSVTRYPSKIKGLSSSILMWSTCKLCSQETTIMPMSDNTWKYSFGKYLELSFWSTPLKPRANLCPHDIHKDFVRCFGFQDHCVRVQYDPIELYDVVVPSAQLNWAVKSDLAMKNRLYSDYVHKMEAFIASVKARLESINLSTVTHDKADDASAVLEKLVQRVDHDHDELLEKLQSKYMASRYFEVVPLNRAIRFMDEKAISWDEAFVDFERNYFPSETDIRNLATLQLKKIFLDRPESQGTELDESPEAKHGAGIRRITDDIIHSEKAHDMLSAVLEEQKRRAEGTNLAHALSNPESLSGKDGSAPVMSHKQAELAVDREGVKHLDLALPTTEPDADKVVLNGNMQIVPPSSVDHDEHTSTTIHEPAPLAPTLVDKIEQIRAAATDEQHDEAEHNGVKSNDSKIPRLSGLLRGSPSGVQHPQLIRAHTQPDSFPRRSSNKGGDQHFFDGVHELPEDQEAFAGELAARGESIPRGHSSIDAGRAVEQKLFDRLAGGASRVGRQISMIPRSVPAQVKSGFDNATRVSALARHFEQLSREFEKERLRERRMRASRMRQSRATYLPSSKPVVEVFNDASEAVRSKPHKEARTEDRRPVARRGNSARSRSDQHPQNATDTVQDSTDAEHTDAYTDNEITGTSFSHGASDTEVEGDATEYERHSSSLATLDRLDPGTSTSSSTLLSPSTLPDLELPLPRHERSSLMKMLSSFWSERSASGWSPLDYPLAATEHVFEDSDIVVREDEPSSVIALALSSNDYLKKLKEFRQGGRRRCKTPHADMNDAAVEQRAIEASLVSETGTHMKYSFGHNQVRAQCKIFYAESFDALRRKCGVSDRFVESLSRSIKWDSKGGKTKSLFLKTLDDRFVIKSLQEVELKAFTRFAPDYFAFMSHTLFHGVPSVIAKMFGLFQVMIKNAASGVEFSSYLLVMENLFYDHKPNRRFDLKGSMRNRKIESTGQPDEVLLDENLVETIFEKPLFVREHARKLVKASVWNDTMWLCRQNVMDYSLMAGFDDPSRQLFVGIIDCIRTYTWDKKLESWIKDRGKNKPTITSPKDYRNRFRVSMMQYVLQSPNVYHEFSRGVAVGGAAGGDLKALQERDARIREERSALFDAQAKGKDADDQLMGAAAAGSIGGAGVAPGAGPTAVSAGVGGVTGGLVKPLVHEPVLMDEHDHLRQRGDVGLVDEAAMRELHSVAM